MRRQQICTDNISAIFESHLRSSSSSNNSNNKCNFELSIERYNFHNLTAIGHAAAIAYATAAGPQQQMQIHSLRHTDTDTYTDTDTQHAPRCICLIMYEDQNAEPGLGRELQLKSHDESTLKLQSFSLSLWV
ncbi:hypothetical protein ACLKA7_016641 [Drosophila subpalustris]